MISRQCCHWLYKDLGSSCSPSGPSLPSIPSLAVRNCHFPAFGISEHPGDKNLRKAWAERALLSGVCPFPAYQMCPISAVLFCQNLSLWSAKFPKSLQWFPGIFLALSSQATQHYLIISLSQLSLQTVLYKIVAFSPFLLFSLLGSAFKDEIRVCWGRTAVSAHCVADLAQAALGRAAPGPEHLEFIQFIYKAELPWVALPMVSLLVQYLILELSAYFHFEGSGDLPLVTNS